MTILDAIKAVQDLVGALTGIKSAPDYPGGGVFPIAIAHLSTGTITPGNPTGARLELHNLAVELHIIDDGSLGDAFVILETLHALIVPALTADTTLTGTIQTYANLTYSTSRTSWYGSPTLVRVYVLNNCKLIV